MCGGFAAGMASLNIKKRVDSKVDVPFSPAGFSQDELLKIWRGLFYCMWVQDEPLLQVTQPLPRHVPGPLPQCIRDALPVCCHAQTDGSKCLKEPLSPPLSPQEGAAGT